MAPRGTQRTNDYYAQCYAWAKDTIARAEERGAVKENLQFLWDYPKTDRIRRAASQAAVTDYKRAHP